MQCPVCQVELQMSERQGVEIDYCPKCRGVWLDRGELDKIIERSASDPGYAQPQVRQQAPQHQPQPQDVYYKQQHHQQQGYHAPYKKKKHKSFLDELFDFD